MRYDFALYAMLVLPREIVQNAHATEYDAINDFLRNHAQNTTTNYRSDNPTTNYLRHVRNAIAHAHVSFRPNDAVTPPSPRTWASSSWTRIAQVPMSSVFNRAAIDSSVEVNLLPSLASQTYTLRIFNRNQAARIVNLTEVPANPLRAPDGLAKTLASFQCYLPPVTLAVILTECSRNTFIMQWFHRMSIRNP